MNIRENTASAHNFIKLASGDPERCRYAFVDSDEHHADRILMGALIPVRFEPQGSNDASRYEVRICSFEVRYESWFLCCMADLEWVLQIEGGYNESCEELLGPAVIVQGAREELARYKGEVPLAVPSAGLGRLGLPTSEADPGDHQLQRRAS